MKNLRKAIAICLFIAVAAFAFSSCVTEISQENTEKNGESEITLVIAGEVITEYKIPLEKVTLNKGLVSVFDYLESIGALDYEIEGTMLSKVGEVENDAAKNSWIYVYTTVESDIDVSQYAATVEYGGKTITSSGVGASDMHIEDGALIYVGTIVYG